MEKTGTFSRLWVRFPGCDSCLDDWGNGQRSTELVLCFALLYNSHPEFALVFTAPTIAILIAVILGFKAGKDNGRTAAFVQKTSAFLTRHRFAVLGLITLLIAASVVGQQIYYRTAARFPVIEFNYVQPVYWKYYAFFDTGNCPFDKFQNLESICVTSDENFNSISAKPSIKEFRFQSNRMLTEADIKRLAQFPNLERLELHHWNSLKNSDSTGLEYFSQIKGLKELSLGVTTQNVGAIPFLKDVPNLESLKLVIFPLMACWAPTLRRKKMMAHGLRSPDFECINLSLSQEGEMGKRLIYS